MIGISTFTRLSSSSSSKPPQWYCCSAVRRGWGNQNPRHAPSQARSWTWQRDSLFVPESASSGWNGSPGNDRQVRVANLVRTGGRKPRDSPPGSVESRRRTWEMKALNPLFLHPAQTWRTRQMRALTSRKEIGNSKGNKLGRKDFKIPPLEEGYRKTLLQLPDRNDPTDPNDYCRRGRKRKMWDERTTKPRGNRSKRSDSGTTSESVARAGLGRRR